ncbi:hypothetical protein Q7M76_04805 [Candidatus Liberibacter asiaticus]|uniref:Uncharacterized protein n=2 Tax=Liberibacter asiaticus TaxID=34021 RepID=C6XGP7_LIBAP|nr:hypothetical protein [Candidatus Liberibacter asiaticus]ACT57550.1 hypothetical protein CLIBASIA_04895 [Candidatus Liberibacter asiaticus str. psy62]AGH17313.1 hypothetical protein WSI_04725 [Candidatus Liberibacter asiaticus str. gxpsy]ALK07599.1 hypothetical protein CD16_04785 [Candidatus Liberibacter asiaticus]ASK53089.1 hypothetical protein B2I23_04845 [Candidatus Liberibacter asiaticus]AWL14414.1 hypothetical protein DIC79_04880 [Candidatus Liberibacter asiaticus]
MIILHCLSVISSMGINYNIPACYPDPLEDSSLFYHFHSTLNLMTLHLPLRLQEEGISQSNLRTDHNVKQHVAITPILQMLDLTNCRHSRVNQWRQISNIIGYKKIKRINCG